MRVDGKFALFDEMRPAALVVSHERSGTHFLMNSLASCYGYVTTPWIDFDRPTFNINYFYSPEVRDLLLALADRPMANVVKSHHVADFFAEELRKIAERYVVFVVCRHPAAVMLSFWRFLHQWPWNEGPKSLDPLAFARSEPCGRLMRFQMRQAASMLHRWAAHVDGWLDAATACPRIVVVRYEDLDEKYEQTVRSFAEPLEHTPQSIARPSRDYNVIPRGPVDPTGRGVLPDVDGLRELCRQQVGQTMSRLGYE
jgi:hypothetical protein